MGEVSREGSGGGRDRPSFHRRPRVSEVPCVDCNKNDVTNINNQIYMVEDT